MNFESLGKIFLLMILFILTGCGHVNSGEAGKDMVSYKLEYESLEVEGKKVYSINDHEYPLLKRVSGTSPNAKYDSYYVVLTSNSDITFEDVDRRFWGSSLILDSDFTIIEYGLIGE